MTIVVSQHEKFDAGQMTIEKLGGKVEIAGFGGKENFPVNMSNVQSFYRKDFDVSNGVTYPRICFELIRGEGGGMSNVYWTYKPGPDGDTYCRVELAWLRQNFTKTIPYNDPRVPA